MDILNSLGFDAPVVLAQSLSFVVLFLLLGIFLYRPFSEVMRQRQEKIENSLSSADEQRKQAEALRGEYEQHLANIAEEARAKLDQAMQDAEAARLRVLESAQGEIRDLHRRSQEQLALEREQLRRELRAEMSEIAVMAAGKALRNRITPDIQSAVVDQVLHELEQQPLH